MRVVGDALSTGLDILQVEKTPEVGTGKPFNGRFAIPVPDGASLQVTDSSYILPQDGGDVAALAAAGLLAQYPMYDNIFFNFLLEDTDIDDLDLTPLPPVSAIAATTVRTRVNTGRGSFGAPAGMYPNMTSLAPINDRVAPSRPGMLVTDTVDIGPATGGAGADEFLVWWHIYTFATSEDIASDFGTFAGANIPASKEILEGVQEPGNLAVYISNDDGVTWTQVGRLQPTDLFVFDTSVRVAFVNSSGTKFHVAAYAVLF